MYLLAALVLPFAAFGDIDPLYTGSEPDHRILSPGVANAGNPDVALDYLQNSHVVWREGRDIYYAKTDKSGNWLLKDGTTPVPYKKLATFTIATFVPSIAVDFAGNAHIAVAGDSSAIFYIKVGPDGNELFRKSVGGAAMTKNATFSGADIAINPKTGLPVIGTLATINKLATFDGIPYTLYQDRVTAFRIDAVGNVTENIFYAAGGWEFGGSMGLFTPPAIAVDSAGIVHAVWKSRMVNDSLTEATGAKQTVTIDYGGGIGQTITKDDPNASLADKYAAKNRHGVTYAKGDIMIEYCHSQKVTGPLTKFIKFGGVYINTPGDIEPGVFSPVPRIAVDKDKKVHVAWSGFDGTRNAILYTRIKPNTKPDHLLKLGSIECRSIIINSSKAEVEPDNCDLAVTSHNVHFVWCDGRDSEDGQQIWHGAVPLKHPTPIAAEEYAVSLARETDPVWPRIAFRPRRDFDKWVGYAGDTHNPPVNEFVATEAETIVNLYQNETVSLQATYKNWPDGSPDPADPEIQLRAPSGAPEPYKVPVSSDAGDGRYTVVWQERFPASSGYSVAFHRLQYKKKIRGLAPRFNVINRLWKPSDATAALGPANAGGAIVDQPIELKPDYAELIRSSNYHYARGVVADGVTPLIISLSLPVGNYRFDMKGRESPANGLAFNILSRSLWLFDHQDQQFTQINGTSEIEVRSEIPGVDPRDVILLIKGFDWTNPDYQWPGPTTSQATIDLKLWQMQNGQGLDMTKDLPFALISFDVAKPPVVLLHTFNNASSGWSREFKQSFENHVGSDLLFTIDYGQSMTPQGPWAEMTEVLGDIGKGVLDDTLKGINSVAGLDKTGAYTADQAILDFQLDKSIYDQLTGELNAIKSQATDLTGVLTDLGILPKIGGGGGGDKGTDWLGVVKKATYWQKRANAALPLSELAKEVTMNLYAIEELIRRREQWAFTRYDAIGHGQGGNLLRLMANDGSKNNPLSTRFIQPRNFGRGRFRTITTIGTAHRGSRLTQYYRHYYNHALEEIKQRLLKYVSLESAPPFESVGVGLILMHYLSREGYMEEKFDPCVGSTAKQGEVILFRATHPAHPGARFHYVSTIIDFDLPGVQNLYGCIGLIRPGPKVPVSFGLFEKVFPATPKPAGAPERFIDGLVGWRSHLAWLDYTNPANAKYVTHLDELTNDYTRQFAAHIPPFSTKATLGIEDPSPPKWQEVYKLMKNSVQGNWGSVAGTIVGEMVKLWFKDNDVLFSPFGTLNTQTNMSLLSNHLVEILSAPVAEHFTPHVDYDPGASGNGNPEPAWGTLVQQDLELEQAVKTNIRYVFNEADQNFAKAFVKILNLRAPTEPGVYHYQLTPPDDLPRDPAYPVNWSAAVLNEIVGNSQGVDVEPDPADDTQVKITVHPEVYGTVLLYCSYFTTDGSLVNISPVVIARMNMGNMIGLHMGTAVPVLTKGESVHVALEAEYDDGFYGPLIPDPTVPQSWSSSDEDIATVSHGLVTAGTKAGQVIITAEYGDFSASIGITVRGERPRVALSNPLDTVDFTGGDTVELRAEAVDPDGAVTHVAFFVNGAFMTEAALDQGDEYVYTWSNLAPGDYEIYAIVVDDEDAFEISESVLIRVANRPPVINSWALPMADQWYGGNVFLQADASDPDGDEISVQFEYSLDSTNGEDGSWSQCYYPLTAPPFDCEWASLPDDDLDDAVWLRVRATDAAGDTSDYMTRRIRIDNSTGGMTFDPHPGETDIPLDVTPTITFDNPVTKADGSLIADGDLASLVGFSQQGAPVPFSATINAEKTVITLTPAGALDGVTPYSVSLIDELKDSVSGDLFRRTEATFVTTFGAPSGVEFRNLVFSGQAGELLDSAVLVNIVDAQSNTVTDSTAEVSVSLNGRGGLSGTLTVNAENGVAVFGDLSMTETGTYTLVASSPGLSGDVSPELTIRPADLAALALQPSKDTAAAGERLSVTVSAFDRFGNLKTDYVGTPNFLSADPAASLPPFYTFYETDRGMHTYRNTLVFRTRGTQTFSVWDGNIVSPPAQVTVANVAPDAPVLKTPADNGYAGLTPWLVVENFSDTDDAQHAATHFQVANESTFTDVVWDSGPLGAVLSVQLPEGVLTEYTDYFWRARVKDSSGDAATEWSAWAEPNAFKTGYGLPFADPFSQNRGWQGLAPAGWMIGPALEGGGEYGFPDPAEDTTDTLDNGVLGYNIGGDYPERVDALVTSPPVDCSAAETVELAFQRWLGVEGNDWGHASIQVSNDNHQWQDVWANPATDVADSQWQSVVYDLSPWAAGQETVFVRFRMGPMLVAYPFCGWNIDDLQISSAETIIGKVILEVPQTKVEVGDVYTLNIYVQEDHPDASGILGAGVLVDFPEALTRYWGPYYTRDCVPSTPWDVLRSGARYADVIRELGGLSSQTGHGDGEPVLLAAIPFIADRSGTAHFQVDPVGGFALPPPFGQLGAWRVQGASLDVSIAPDTLEPLARMTLVGPDEPVALGNPFVISVYVEEMSAQAAGVMGGPFDLYFDFTRVSALGFSAAQAIQPPYTDVGLVSGTLLENRIDELGGATTTTGHGNGTKKLYAVLTFQANALGEAVLKAEAGASGLALSTPVGQLDFTRIDYGAPVAVDIRQNYQLTVVNGSFTVGNGNYVEGKVVPIAASAPATGMAFSHWEGDVGYLVNANTANTSLTMPAADVMVTAVYVPIDYVLTVNSGSGSTAAAHYQDALPIQANPAATGKAFDQWTGDATYVDTPTAESATVTMPAAHVTVTATYRNILYTLEVGNGSGDTTTAIYQQPITIVADPPPSGFVFAHWTGDSDVLANEFASSTTVTMPAGNVAVTATYSAIDYALTVNNGTADTATANYQDVIPISAGPPATGQAFAGWTGDTAFLVDPLAPDTDVRMPAQHVTVTATYSPIPFVMVVVNGTGTGTYHYGDVVNISANVPAPGEPAFSGWGGHTDVIADPAAATTAITMPASHVGVLALYGIQQTGGTVDIPLAKGWTCFSVPFETQSPEGLPEYADLISGHVWRWDGINLVPVQSTHREGAYLDPRYGYWVYSPNGGTLQLNSIAR